MRQTFAEVLLKLNCYYDMVVVRGEHDEGATNPAPRELVAWVTSSREELSIVLPSADALITLPRDTTCMTLYNPRPELLDLVRCLAAASGLFVWQPGSCS